MKNGTERLLERIRTIYTLEAEKIRPETTADAVLAVIYREGTLTPSNQPLFGRWTLAAAAAVLIVLGGTNAVLYNSLIDSWFMVLVSDVMNPFSLNDIAALLFL